MRMTQKREKTEDVVFKALADPSRRRLLDMLREQDGQSLTALEAMLPMTRFGVMKHLRILEAASLITTRKVGRERLHYLNPVAVQIIYDRWVSKYAQPFTETMAGLKRRMEGRRMAEKPSHVYHIFINTTPEKLWHALTNGEMSRQYYFGSSVESTWKKGASYRYPNPGGGTYLEGEVLEIDPPRRLVTTFRPLWNGAGELSPDAVATSKVTYEIESLDGVCKLTLVHEEMDYEDKLISEFREGWARILSGLKSLLETGKPLAA